MARRSAADSANGKSSTVGNRRSDRFLSGLRRASRVTFVSHVNPDPDSLGAMFGLAHLVESRLGIPTRMTRDGMISRAENRTMVDLLKLELVKLDQVTWAENELVVMVDSQPGTGRHSFGPDTPLYGVIDHHETPGDLEDVEFTDIRPNFGATCTLVTKYLTEQNVPIPQRLATALFYGIETEISGYPRESNATDDSAIHYLYPLADKDLLARIRNARLPLSHFEGLLQALQTCFIYENLIISWVDDLPFPEQAAEIVDFLIRFEEVDWALCGGVHNDKLILSARTAKPGAKAGEVLQQVVGKLGKAGGHDRRAGGCIHLSSTAASAIDDVQAELRRRFLKALKIDDCRGTRLVPLREMLQNLDAR